MQQSRPNDLSAYWMPFTHNRDFKRDPRMILSAKGMYYQSDDGRDILDATAGLWCVNAGHARRRITEAVRMQLDELDYAPNLQFGHPKPLRLPIVWACCPPGTCLFHQRFVRSIPPEDSPITKRRAARVARPC